MTTLPTQPSEEYPLRNSPLTPLLRERIDESCRSLMQAARIADLEGENARLRARLAECRSSTPHEI